MIEFDLLMQLAITADIKKGPTQDCTKQIVCIIFVCIMFVYILIYLMSALNISIFQKRSSDSNKKVFRDRERECVCVRERERARERARERDREKDGEGGI